MRATPRWFFCALLCALLSACGKPATLTPPIYASMPAADADAEQAPDHRLPLDTHPLGYHLTLEAVPERTSYSGQIVIDVALDRPRESIYLHAKGIRASSVRVVRPGAESLVGTLESVGDSGLSAVRLKQPAGPGVLAIEIDFTADVGTRLSGLYRAQAGGVPYLFTQFEAISAREAFPCFDEPRFKTPFDVTLRVKKEHVAISNTREVASRDVADGMREVTFARTEKLPTYLLALAVGPFDVVEAPALPETALRDHPLPLRGIAVKGRGAELAFALRETPKLVEALEQYFAVAYPYDKLDLLAVPDFGAGAMENAGAITFRDTLLLLRDDAAEGQKRLFMYVNAHELAHQWFGNLVTMPWWDDIWLNEAFATWMGTRVVDEVHPEYEALLGALSATHHAMDVDSQASARQIRQPIESDHDIANAFDAITYSKGGAVLSMFERYLGADTFRAGLRLYMKRHRFANATARDLVSALAEASQNAAMSDAFFSFLEQPGVPLVETRVECAGDAAALLLSQSRYLPLGSRASRDASWQIPVCARYAVGAAQKEQCTLLSERTARVALGSSSCPSWVVPNAGAQGYYRWSLDTGELGKLGAAQAELSAAEQMSLVTNVYAGLRAGTIDADQALRSLEALAAIDKRTVLESVLKAFASVRDDLLDDASLPGYRALLSRVLTPTFRRLGLFPTRTNVNGEEKLMRAMVVRALAFGAEDPALLRELAGLGRARLGLATDARLQSLPSELIDLSLVAALREGGAPLFDKAVEQMVQTDDGLTRSRLLAALVALKDPALTERVLALSLDARLRTNERLAPLAGQMAQRETRARAYAWFKDHYDGLIALLGEHARAGVVGPLANFCSEDEARDVESFFSTRIGQLEGGPRRLQLTLESIRLCAALSAAQAEKARAFFKSAPAAAPAKTLAPRAVAPKAAAPKPVAPDAGR